VITRSTSSTSECWFRHIPWSPGLRVLKNFVPRTSAIWIWKFFHITSQSLRAELLRAACTAHLRNSVGGVVVTCLWATPHCDFLPRKSIAVPYSQKTADSLQEWPDLIQGWYLSRSNWHGTVLCSGTSPCLFIFSVNFASFRSVLTLREISYCCRASHTSIFNYNSM
jgi:hypothetical protein